MNETRIVRDEAKIGRGYDRWMRRGGLSSVIYAYFAGVQGAMLVNTPAFRLPTELQLRPEHKVLDVGCGRGSVLSVLASRVAFDTPPIGVDISRGMLEMGRRDSARTGAKIALTQGSALSLPLADETFDIVTCAYVVKHLPDVGMLRMLQEIRRVLTPGGIAVLWEFAPTRSPALNRWHEWLLTRGVDVCNLRNYTQLRAFAIGAGFEWVGNANLRPFLFPPIPRISLLLGKAPAEWVND